MRMQSAILPSPDFNLHIQQTLKILYLQSYMLYLKNWSGDPTFLMHKIIQQQKQNVFAKL